MSRDALTKWIARGGVQLPAIISAPGLATDASGNVIAGSAPAPSISLDPWHIVGSGGVEPGFTNSWVNYGGTNQVAGFRKDILGRVHLRGMIKTGTLTLAAFTLPVGYRPSKDEYFSTEANNLTGMVYVTTAGAVIPFNGSNADFSLNVIDFDTDSVSSLSGLGGPTTVVTSLPTGTSVGQRCLFQTSGMVAMSPAVVWELVYDGTKWVPTGAAEPMIDEVITDQNLATGAAGMVDLATAGPQITLPAAGDYLYFFSANAYPTGTPTTTMQIGLSIAAAAPANQDLSQTPTTGGTAGTMNQQGRLLGRSASDVLKLQYLRSLTISTNFRWRKLIVWPLRLG